MFPTTRANLTVVTTINTTLNDGTGGGASDGTLGSTSSLPFYASMPAELVTRVITSDLSSATATISTAGLSATSIDYLNNIRTRVDESILDIYFDRPNIGPYWHANGTFKSESLRNGARDDIIQGLFNYDARYFLRQRSGTGQGGNNDNYEYPTRHNYMNNPMVEALVREHTIPAGTVDDTGAGGTYRITTGTPHGVYSGMTFSTQGVSAGPSILDKKYWFDGLYQEISNNTLGTDTDSKFRFNANIGTNYLVDGTTAAGSQILAFGVGTSWIPIYFQPPRYFDVVDGGAAVKFYHDTALTEQLIPGFGYISSVSAGFNNEVDGGAATGGYQVNTSSPSGAVAYTHMMFEDLPQIFEPPAGFTGNVGIFEQADLDSVTVQTDVWNFNIVGTPSTDVFSIYDGQISNLAGANSAGWQNMHNYNLPMYWKRYLGSGSNIQFYKDAALTQLFQLGVESSTVANIAYVSSNARVTFSSDYPPIIEGMTVHFTGTNTGFSDTLNANSVAGTTPWRITLSANHSFQNGQPIHRVQGNTYYYVKTSGMAANEIEVYSNAALTTAVQMSVNDDFRPAYFPERISSQVWELYADAAFTTPITTVISTAGFTTGSMARGSGSGMNGTISAPATAYFAPMFYCRMGGYYSATLWVDAARTTPYAYRNKGGFGKNNIATVGTVSGSGAATYRINNIANKAGFTANVKPQTGWAAQAFWVTKISKFVLDVYADPDRTAEITSPAIATAQATGVFSPTYLFNPVLGQVPGTSQYRYRLDTFKEYNTGGTTYFYDSTGDGIADSIDASWPNSDFAYYTPHYATNTIYSGGSLRPDIITQEYNFSNSGAYYGSLRRCTGNITLANNDPLYGPVYYNPADYGGTDTGPCVYSLEAPGMIETSTPFLVGIERAADTVIVVTGADDLALANTNPVWDTVNNMIDRADRQWPTTTNPSSVTWTIEQPNQVLETMNSTRFTRAKDVTQYRIRYIYPPLTKEQIKPYLDVIYAARGSFKPFRLPFPEAAGINQTSADGALTIRYFDRASNAYVAFQMRVRESANGGTKLLKVDGAPISLNQTVGNAGAGTSYVFGVGHAMGARHEYLINEPGFISSLGGYFLPINTVESNSYGEINIRLNNGVPGEFPLGTKMFRDAAYLNAFLDGNTVEIKVDVLGYHYMEVEFVTKKIF